MPRKLADYNIQIQHKTNSRYDKLYPITNSSNIEDLDDKLSGIQTNANNISSLQSSVNSLQTTINGFSSSITNLQNKRNIYILKDSNTSDPTTYTYTITKGLYKFTLYPSLFFSNNRYHVKLHFDNFKYNNFSNTENYVILQAGFSTYSVATTATSAPPMNSILSMSRMDIVDTTNGSSFYLEGETYGATINTWVPITVTLSGKSVSSKMSNYCYYNASSVKWTQTQATYFYIWGLNISFNGVYLEIEKLSSDAIAN